MDEKVIDIVTSLDKKVDVILQRIENMERAHSSQAKYTRELECRVTTNEKDIIKMKTVVSTQNETKKNNLRVIDIILVSLMVILTILTYLK